MTDWDNNGELVLELNQRSHVTLPTQYHLSCSYIELKYFMMRANKCDIESSPSNGEHERD